MPSMLENPLWKPSESKIKASTMYDFMKIINKNYS